MASAQDNFNTWAQQREEAANNGESFTKDAPLGGIDTSQYTYASFIYPKDLGAPGAGKDHYMIFHINETSTTQFQTRNVDGSVGQVGAPTDPATINQNTLDDNDTDNYQASKVPIRRVATTIVLYMPPNIQTNYAADWEVTGLGLAEDMDNFLHGGSFKNLWESGKASMKRNAMQRLNEFSNLSVKEAISRRGRFVINNHAEVIFNGVGFRDFTFNFRFTPESEDEALNVDNIIQAFKFYGAPEILTGTAGRYWIYPGEFDIQYFSNGKENLFLNKISTCALTNISVNYTAAGQWSAHRPHKSGLGSPSVCTDISLSFRELEIITKRRILQKY